jgi:hypothetical protein
MRSKFIKATAVGIISIIAVITNSANAGLIDRGNGLIYDDVLDVTWMQDANLAGGLMSWSDALLWADTLEYGGYDDWRLTTIFDIDADGCADSFSYGGTDCGFNSLTSYTDPATGEVYYSELAYMFHENLGLNSYLDTDGNIVDGGIKRDTVVSFIDAESGNTVTFNDVRSAYWSGTEYALYDDSAWYFDYLYGKQAFFGNFSLHGWAVRDGDVSLVDATIPEPSTLSIFSLGFLGLLLLRFKKPPQY